jgi:phospholipase/carboxylesterase
MKSSLVTISGMECLQVLGEQKDVAVIMLHGYGANMHDLFPLWELWHREGFNWYFPNGPHSLNMGFYEGRAWFNIDVEALERAIREGRTRDLRESVPLELDKTLEGLEALIFEVAKVHKKIILGGFSQGAMCSSHLAMRGSLPLTGLVLLSGALVAQEKCPQSLSSDKALPFYQSHGTRDPILSLEGARDLEKKLHTLHFKGALHPFTGGHEIPPSVIGEVKDFLKEITFLK